MTQIDAARILAQLAGGALLLASCAPAPAGSKPDGDGGAPGGPVGEDASPDDGDDGSGPTLSPADPGVGGGGDDSPPGALAFASPAAGSVVSGLVDVLISIPEGVERVALSASGVEIGEAAVSPGTALYRWDSGMVPNGDAVFRVEVPDAGEAAELALKVENDDLVVYEVGTVENGPEGTGALRPLHLGALTSLTYTVVGSRDDAYYLPVTQDPDGTLLITADGDPWDDLVRAFATHSPATAMIPNTPEVEVDEGQWTVWPASDSTEGQATLHALVKRAWSEPRAGVIDLALYFVAGGRLDPETALADADFAALMAEVEDILLQASIAFGEIGAYAMEDPEGLEVSSYDEVDRLLSRTLDRGRVLNLVFIDRFTGDMDGVAGVTGGLPGPALMHGNRYAGVVVALDETHPYDHIAIATAHEIGHYLGLFHTSDEDGEHPDPLPDTPECASNPCTGEETWNLMYPTLTGSTTLTDDQGWVMLRHPLVRLVDPSEIPSAPSSAGRMAAPEPRAPAPLPRCALEDRLGKADGLR